MKFAYQQPHEESGGELSNNVGPQDSFETGDSESSKLEFAASQWQQLVSNAEGLFQKLVQNGLPEDSKSQIQQWLCLKQEYEDYFSHDVTMTHGHEKLERIDEVTESENESSTEKSSIHSSFSEIESTEDLNSDDVQDETYGIGNVMSSKRDKNKFSDKLQSHMLQFKSTTDNLVNEHIGSINFNEDSLVKPTKDGYNFNIKRKPNSVSGEVYDRATKLINHDTKSKKVKEKSKVEYPVHKMLVPVNTVREEAYRSEIVNLRDTKGVLMDQRRSLDSKLNKEKVFSREEERKYIEVDEAIEAIDAAIEHKNQLLCGDSVGYKTPKDKGEKMLIERLMKLTDPEMRSLLHKYFKKAVDLRESLQMMEQQLTDQDHQIATQTWKIQALSNALQQARLESERRLIMVTREHQQKLHLMYSGHYSGDTSSSLDKTGDNSASTSADPPYLELPGTSHHQVHQQGHHKSVFIPQQNRKKLQGSSTHTTKVTRGRKKLIIQQQ